MSIGALAEILEGHVHWADLPPLGGHLEPVRRWIPFGVPVEPGDVVFASGSDDEQFLEHAFTQQALAVVSRRRVQPWDGCASIQVDDCGTAQLRLCAWLRSQLSGATVMILHGDGNDLEWRMLRQVLAGHASPARESRTNPSDPTWQFLDTRTDDRYVVVDASPATFSHDLVAVLQPDVVVLTDECAARLAVTAFDTLRPGTQLVVNADRVTFRDLCGQRPTGVLRFGRDNQDYDIYWSSVGERQDRIFLECRGQSVAIPEECDGAMSVVGCLAAVAYCLGTDLAPVIAEFAEKKKKTPELIWT
ncbi:MAG: hypothetical protein KDA99_18295 [Planctomycetales bacterium]|nr:hypothetical protein [Planctomycetales bacterium]